MYHGGYGVPQDYAQAAFWCRKAAEQGFAPAQNNLGALYHHGHGVPQDDTQAVFWCRKAVEQGYTGEKYRDEAASHLTPADLSREQEPARKWFESTINPYVESGQV